MVFCKYAWFIDYPLILHYISNRIQSIGMKYNQRLDIFLNENMSMG